jgi:hypothetical protein
VNFVKGEILLCGMAMPPLTKFSGDSAILVNSWLERVFIDLYEAFLKILIPISIWNDGLKHLKKNSFQPTQTN